MANILLVEDDEFLREAIEASLTDNEHKVEVAPHGKAAKEILGVQKFDLILSDIQMPYFNGVELLEWIRGKKISTPFILMTGFSNLLETKTAHELGADGFLTKPFQPEDLEEVLNDVLGAQEEPHADEKSERNEKVYCKVSISEFVSKPKIDFDVYIRLSEKKFIKIGHAGSEIPFEQIQRYKEMGQNFLYIDNKDFSKLVDFNLTVSRALSKNQSVPKEKKINFMKYTGEVIMEKAFVDGVDQESFTHAKEFLDLTMNVVSEDSTLFDLLNLLNDHADYIYAHSVGVALFSIMIARKLEYESQRIFFQLSMAGMFHDLGKKEIEREILDKPRALLSVEECRLLESHPIRSRDILLSISGLPEAVAQLALEHHEDQLGQGCPNRKTKAQLHPLSKVLYLANLFVGKALAGPNQSSLTADAAVESIERNYGARVDTKCMEALKSLFRAG